MRPIVVGIAGGTASGKTTAARALREALRERAVLIHHDSYYRSLPPGHDSGGWNFDHPDALETELLVDHVDRWSRGEGVDVPVYDFARHRRAEPAAWERVPACPVVIVEGILVLAHPELRQRMHHKVYVDTPDDVRLARRIQRDLRERGREVHDVLEQYMATVRPMHEAWVVPSRDHADLVLSGLDPVQRLVERLAALLP